MRNDIKLQRNPQEKSQQAERHINVNQLFWLLIQRQRHSVDKIHGCPL